VRDVYWLRVSRSGCVGVRDTTEALIAGFQENNSEEQEGWDKQRTSTLNELIIRVEAIIMPPSAAFWQDAVMGLYCTSLITLFYKLIMLSEMFACK
jgi:hypothetical protein